jgi:uncharacterized repeat protein (TIGR03803 family)
VNKPALLRIVCISLFCGVTAIDSPGQLLTTLHDFDRFHGEGRDPNAALIKATDGDFYGTTQYGGTSGNCLDVGCGTVFKISRHGTLTTLHSFSGADGLYPSAALVQASDGNFYGTTADGGPYDNCFGITCGTVFKITPAGTLTTLHNFCRHSGCPDGFQPLAGLVQARDGNFYGTTAGGGSSGNCYLGCGTVFKITPAGVLTTLHSFDTNDGANPSAGLVHSSDGNFYGTTEYGGANNGGTVFKITPAGRLTTLYSFCSQSDCSDGYLPLAALVQARDGNFYGTTLIGGTSGDGTVFKITPRGALTTLHSFDYSDGVALYAGLVQGADGDLYGTTQGGGANGDGTLFKISTAGTLTTLHSFRGTDGIYPYGGLVQGTDRNFYGTTGYAGGPSLDGTVFRLTTRRTCVVCPPLLNEGK